MTNFNPSKEKIECANKFIQGNVLLSDMVSADCSPLELSALVQWRLAKDVLRELQEVLKNIDVQTGADRYLTHQAKARIASAELLYIDANTLSR